MWGLEMGRVMMLGRVFRGRLRFDGISNRLGVVIIYLRGHTKGMIKRMRLCSHRAKRTQEQMDEGPLW
jgi:hypothetical protein